MVALSKLNLKNKTQKINIKEGKEKISYLRVKFVHFYVKKQEQR